MVRHQALKGLYETERTIGCGGFAKVKLATHLATGEKVAIKIMDKSLLGDDLPRIKLELKALKTLSHEHICKLYQVIETDTNFFIIMEYCSGGELFDHIVEKNRLSESESRMFFRQIVSAVAYLHSLGYAHRDLKPENVLLDKNQNLKLIDFGLCARPVGGIESPLYTSCGSPTYAAPELVLGKQYLGPEVDVWAMGVLLYALLAGSLPFDDLNIDNLYKKILSGRYEEPMFMSKESLCLIKSMLQVDPKERISVNDLLSHPWLTLGILDPVHIRTEDFRCYDIDCVNTMANYHQVEADTMWNYLKRWKYNYHTATYFLLLEKKKRGQPLKLNSSFVKYPLPVKIRDTPNKYAQNNSPCTVTSVNNKLKLNTPVLSTMSETSTPNRNKENTPVMRSEDFSSPSFIEPRRPSSIRKPQKRIRSPGPDDSSPVPAKKITKENTTPVNTPDGKRPQVNSETPGSARRVLGSIERSLHKVRHALTPRKQPAVGEETSSITQPASLTCKNLCNVSTTQCRDPEFVINELLKALKKKGIHCHRKGFKLRGKVEPNFINRCGGCSFELEICYLPNLGPPQLSEISNTPTKSILKKGPLNRNTPVSDDNEGILTTAIGFNSKDNKSNCCTYSNNAMNALVGIRRKRLKGDSWCYKKVCEEVLALTATDFRNITESSV